MPGYAAVVLAGGQGRRLGGVDKPALTVGGRTLLTRVLGAVADADPQVVVGPVRSDVPQTVLQVQEHPPGGGPVAAVAAGLAAVPDTTAVAAVLAADLPFLSSTAVRALLQALYSGDHDGVVLLDVDHRPQWLCGVWRTVPLRRRLAELEPLPGRSMRQLLAGLRHAGRAGHDLPAPPPWYDCDTEEDLRRAEEWRP